MCCDFRAAEASVRSGRGSKQGRAEGGAEGGNRVTGSGQIGTSGWRRGGGARGEGIGHPQGPQSLGTLSSVFGATEQHDSDL